MKRQIPVAGMVTSQRVADDGASGPSKEQDPECSLCHQYCHLATVECDCCPGRCACLPHAGGLCACPPSRWRLAFRYSLADLERALETADAAAAFLGASYTQQQHLRA